MMSGSVTRSTQKTRKSEVRLIKVFCPRLVGVSMSIGPIGSAIDKNRQRDEHISMQEEGRPEGREGGGQTHLEARRVRV